MKFKYVMVNLIFPVILSEAVQHNQVTGDITSAGFFMITREDGKVRVCCYGFSQSLNLQPVEGDERIIEKFFNDMVKGIN
jgi:hypothetical protein